MKLLLDTHAVVWWWIDDPRLPLAARAAITDAGNTVCVSAVSAWEIATKNRIGKWAGVEQIVDEFPTLFAAVPVRGDANLSGARPPGRSFDGSASGSFRPNADRPVDGGKGDIDQCGRRIPRLRCRTALGLNSV